MFKSICTAIGLVALATSAQAQNPYLEPLGLDSNNRGTGCYADCYRGQQLQQQRNDDYRASQDRWQQEQNRMDSERRQRNDDYFDNRRDR